MLDVNNKRNWLWDIWEFSAPSTQFLCKAKAVLKNKVLATFLAVQWLRLHASNAGGVGSIPCQGTKIPHAVWRGGKKIKNKIYLSIYLFIYLFGCIGS